MHTHDIAPTCKIVCVSAHLPVVRRGGVVLIRPGERLVGSEVGPERIKCVDIGGGCVDWCVMFVWVCVCCVWLCLMVCDGGSGVGSEVGPEQIETLAAAVGVVSV